MIALLFIDVREKRFVKTSVIVKPLKTLPPYGIYCSINANNHPMKTSKKCITRHIYNCHLFTIRNVKCGSCKKKTDQRDFGTVK